jgi:hypothetical protein
MALRAIPVTSSVSYGCQVTYNFLTLVNTTRYATCK